MKKINTLIFTCLLALLAGKSTMAFADEKIATQSIQEIDWGKYAVDVNTIRYFKEWASDDVKKKYYNGAFYIYDVKKKLFVTTGGQYGVQPILAQTAMQFSLEYKEVADGESSSEGESSKKVYYYLHSNVLNGEEGTGDCLGIKAKAADTDYTSDKKNRIVFIDRGYEGSDNPKYSEEGYEESNHTQWTLVTTQTETNDYGAGFEHRPYTHKLCSSWDDKSHYLSYYENADEKKKFYVESVSEADAAEFYFILVKDYNDLIANSSYEYIDVSNLIKDARFERMNKDAGETVGVEDSEFYSREWRNSNSWHFSYEKLYTNISSDGVKPVYRRLHNYFINDTRYLTGNILAYGTAWIGTEYSGDQTGSQVLYQDIKNIQPGYYRVECQGFYDGTEANAYLFGQGFLTEQQMTDGEQLHDLNKGNTVAIKDIKTRIKPITSEDKVVFDETQLLDDSGNPITTQDSYAENMFRAGKFLADNNPYGDGTKYNNTVYVKVEKTNSDGTGNLRIGIRKKGSLSDVYVDNFKLYYCGDKEWYLNATNKSKDAEWTVGTPKVGINKEASEYPVRYNLSRKFSVKKWNSFIVPFDINADQVKTAFSTGEQVKVSEFKEVTDKEIVFKAVDIEKDGIKANWPYIIWLSKEPDNEAYSFQYGANVSVSIPENSYLYHIDGVTPKEITDVAPTVSSSNGSVTFHGYYYRPAEGAPAGSYVLADGDLTGNMYHLNAQYKGNGIVGTCWYMTINDATPAKSLRFVMEGLDGKTTDLNGTATAIEGIPMDNDVHTTMGNRNDGYVYNLNGQRVGKASDLHNLQSGVYLMNGSKYIIK